MALGIHFVFHSFMLKISEPFGAILPSNFGFLYFAVTGKRAASQGVTKSGH